MSGLVRKICVVSATPLTVFFFLKPHLAALSCHFEVTLACNFGSDADAYLPPLDLPVHQESIGIERKISLVRDLVALFKLYRLFKRERYELVLSVVPKAGLLGMVAGALAGVKVRVHIFQGEVWASRSGVMRWLLRAMDWITAISASHVLAVSPSERCFLEEQGIVKPGKIRVLGSGSICGVDMSRFRPDAETRSSLRRKQGIPDDAVVCLFLGRLTADKGVYDLVRAFALCQENNPKLWLLLVGPDEEDVRPLIRAFLSGDAVERFRVEGFTNVPERYIAAADLLCLPSYREGFGMVVIEAAAVGIPSIGSDIYGLTDSIVEGKTGLLVPPADPVNLAAALSRVAGDDALRARLGLAARLRVENEFKQEKVVAQYVQYLRELVAS